MLCEEKGAELRSIPTSDAGETEIAAYGKLLDDAKRLVTSARTTNMARIASTNAMPNASPSLRGGHGHFIVVV
jgi:hypothetical protein